MESKIKILILENDPNDIGLLQFELKRGGLHFISAEVQTRQEYEQALGSLQPDIILADYSLPSFDGLSAFRIMQDISPGTPFIIVSGVIGEENAVELIKMGVTDYVLKEKMYQLAPKIHRALQEAQDRKQKKIAQRQLRQRKKQLQKIMDLSLDVICTLDQEGRFVTLGAASKSAWGYSPQELIGQKAIDLVYPADQESTHLAIAELKQGRDMVNFGNRFIRKDGSEVPLLWSVHWNPKEQLGYGVARDATEIKQAEEKIKNNEKRFRTLLQNSNDGLTLFAADGTILERSSSALKILGFGTDDGPEKFTLGLHHPDDQAKVTEVWNQVRNNPNQKLRIQYRFRMPNGSYKWLESTLHNQLQEPAIAAIVVNFRDITEKKIAEIALQTSEDRLKQAQELGQMGSWEMNWADQSLLWSDEMYRMFGVDKKDITPSLETLISLIHPEDLPAFLKRFDEISASLEDSAMTYRIIRPDGQVRYVSGAGRFEFDEKGKPTCLYGIQQDITERKLAEIALEKSEKKYRDLFHLSPTPMWVFEVDTMAFLDVNEAAIKQYGYSKEEFLAMTLYDIRRREDFEKLEAMANFLKRTLGHYSYIAKHIKKSGEEIDVDIKNSFIDIAGRKARLVMATDISQQMKYIQAIQEQNVRLREIAWTQSHVVRAPLARMMGLISMLEHDLPEEGSGSNKFSTTDLLSLVSASAHELDGIIREIVRKSEQVQDQPILEELEALDK